VAAKDQRVLEKRRIKRNHLEVRWEKKNIQNPFIIRGQVAGHSVRIQIDSKLDLNCISERFVKRHNLSMMKHSDLVRVKRFNEDIVGVIRKQTKVPVMLREVEQEG
jgi:hypothetical protein